MFPVVYRKRTFLRQPQNLPNGASGKGPLTSPVHERGQRGRGSAHGLRPRCLTTRILMWFFSQVVHSMLSGCQLRDRLDLTETPRLIEPGLKRSVQAEHDVVDPTAT